MKKAIVGVIFCMSLIIAWRIAKQFYYAPHAFTVADKEPLKQKNIIDSIETQSLDDSIICTWGCGPDAEYKGGAVAWQRFLQRTLVYPQQAVKRNIEGRVIVQFTIDSIGNVTDVKAVNGPSLLRASAIKVIRGSSGNWIPAMLNNKKVKSYKKQPITFKLSE
ncbi:MAG: energy transducer TonB [Chitinophagaceae bacterium]